ncbi:8-oxo-dGTP diphosphatase [Legionella jamestowniensis DSM 19215]|uniref:8-oxo-dGTP diphosphatase n=1 Tax=Legionella jamestowniensis TaxID=455 RepID=A0A0W0UK24_9GAMM|nr:Mutator protein MutT [Legionella jamestowniensis]SFL97769.1 8-oxo-dGTP diphosphatase [Legionella jamestowniensis DSM 19215]
MKVAVAVILNQSGEVLITRRPSHVPHGGLWEFPGGKVEPDETPAEALVREIKEEVGLEILSFRFLEEITHAYSTKVVSLLIFVVRDYKGEPHCLESQMDLRWATISDLTTYEFPEANIKIFDLLHGLETVN